MPRISDFKVGLKPSQLEAIENLEREYESEIEELYLQIQSLIAENKKLKEIGKANNLKKAVFALLYDQYNVPDIDLNDRDDSYVDYIVEALIDKNKNVCPYKNYNCIECCEINNINCYLQGLNIDCNNEIEKIWRKFIGVED